VSAALTDTLWAAESLGIQDWAWEEIQKLITIENAQGLIDDTAQNFKRHQIELQDLSELMISSGYESTMVAPIQFNYGRIMHGKKIPSRNQARNK
jgi:hypothetical protein